MLSSMHHHHHHLVGKFVRRHRHPERVVYKRCCLGSGTVSVFEATSRRCWCIQYLFPISAPERVIHLSLHHIQLGIIPLFEVVRN